MYSLCFFRLVHTVWWFCLSLWQIRTYLSSLCCVWYYIILLCLHLTFYSYQVNFSRHIANRDDSFFWPGGTVRVWNPAYIHLNKTNISTIRQKFIRLSFHYLVYFRKQGKHFHSNKISQFPMQAHTLYTACFIYQSELLVVRDEVRISSCSCNAFQFRPAIIALHFRSGSCVKIGSKLSNHNARFWPISNQLIQPKSAPRIRSLYIPNERESNWVTWCSLDM